MVSFKLTEEQEEIRRLARTFAEKEIIPVAREYDEQEEVPWAVVEKAFAAELMNLEVPVEYNGQGQGPMTVAIVSEELAYGCLGVSGSFANNGLALLPILLAGTQEQQQHFLKPFCATPQLASFCLTEPAAGSDVAAMTTTARRDGDDYVLQGMKHFITNGGVAKLYTVFAKTDPSQGAKGISCFVVARDTPGLKPGKKEKKMGDRAAQVSEVIFDDVRVPRQNLLGNEGAGFKIAMMTLDHSRPMVAATAVGVARRALEEAIKYSKERVQFGKPICENQAIQFMLADMAIRVEAARTLVWKASWMVEEGLPVTKDGAMAKCYASDVAMSVSVDSVQIFGGYGYMREYPVEKLVRDAKVIQIYEGTNQVQRMVIAAALLR